MNQQSPESPHKRIRALRRQREVSQLDVARELGISQSQYSLYELGYIELPEKLLRRLYKVLGSCSATMGGDAPVSDSKKPLRQIPKRSRRLTLAQ